MSVKILLDTCVVSELRKKSPHPQVVKAFSRLHSQDIFLSSVTLGEIAKGIYLLDRSQYKQELCTWFKNLQNDYQAQILGIDTETAILWGEMTATAQKQGYCISTCDGLIAATAKRWGLHVMTRNTSDFKPTQVDLVNPWV